MKAFLGFVFGLGLGLVTASGVAIIATPEQQQIPACQEDEHVSRDFHCVGDGVSNYGEDGYWHYVPPVELAK